MPAQDRKQKYSAFSLYTWGVVETRKQNLRASTGQTREEVGVTSLGGGAKAAQGAGV